MRKLAVALIHFFGVYLLKVAMVRKAFQGRSVLGLAPQEERYWGTTEWVSWPEPERAMEGNETPSLSELAGLPLT
jgi:hypothetical protein